MTQSEVPDPDLARTITDAAIRARVARIVELPSAEAPSRLERLSRNTVVQLFLGFVLTGVVGSWLANYYQSKAQDSRLAIDRQATLRLQALQVLDSVGLVLNKGYYIYGRYADALALTPGVNTARARQAFDLFNEDFEKREIVDAAKICAYFGSEASHRFVGVVRQFHHINPVIRAAVGLGENLYILRDSVYALTVGLVGLAGRTDLIVSSEQRCATLASTDSRG